MDKCPDMITIQAYIDGEKIDDSIIAHMKGCQSCRRRLMEIRVLKETADRLAGKEKLPEGFMEALSARTRDSSLLAAITTAAIFLVLVISAYFLNPGYLQWWFSAGITGLVGFVIDTFVGFLIMGQNLAPALILAAVAAAVIIELFVLIKLKTVEGT
ncbi:MAG: hypothetical protein AVO34_04545 [Firmicutes bacterium ML8_F2]|jgi:hypothetical protein|nr:MAG: hypothetical protein AVO34_04545 [Firmicutes bacterium ML8_F2]